MELSAFDQFNKLKPSSITMSQFNYNLSDESDQDYGTTVTHLFILLQLILTKGFISILLKTTWDQIDGCTN